MAKSTLNFGLFIAFLATLILLAATKLDYVLTYAVPHNGCLVKAGVFCKTQGIVPPSPDAQLYGVLMAVLAIACVAFLVRALRSK